MGIDGGFLIADYAENTDFLFGRKRRPTTCPQPTNCWGRRDYIDDEFVRIYSWFDGSKKKGEFPFSVILRRIKWQDEKRWMSIVFAP
ncbi:MAG: hypothetical protein MUO27_08785 [Sedimentisphaerales bacterium]|nr:hypothetical protein [Sedimentisphaerales bacterium]